MQEDGPQPAPRRPTSREFLAEVDGTAAADFRVLDSTLPKAKTWKCPVPALSPIVMLSTATSPIVSGAGPAQGTARRARLRPVRQALLAQEMMPRPQRWVGRSWIQLYPLPALQWHSRYSGSSDGGSRKAPSSPSPPRSHRALPSLDPEEGRVLLERDDRGPPAGRPLRLSCRARGKQERSGQAERSSRGTHDAWHRHVCAGGPTYRRPAGVAAAPLAPSYPPLCPRTREAAAAPGRRRSRRPRTAGTPRTRTLRRGSAAIPSI